MKVSEQEANLFFELMLPLQQYVNEKMHLFPEVKSLQDYRNCSYDVKLPVRNALYENIGLIDAFVETNQQLMPEEHLSIIKGWKQFVRGEFYIERILKKYTIFIGNNNRVYAVLALHDGFDTMVDPRALPFMVKAVLLPFKGKIVFDGLLEGYTSLYFGSGIKGDLRETYLAAKENGYIIDGSDTSKKAARVSKDWGKELAALEKAARKLKGGAGQAPIVDRAFKLIKSSINFAKMAAAEPDKISDLWNALDKTNRVLNAAEDILHRASRYTKSNN